MQTKALIVPDRAYQTTEGLVQHGVWRYWAKTLLHRL